VVVGVDPPVDAGLGRLERLERRDVVQQLGPQALVEPLDFPCRGRLTGQSRLVLWISRVVVPGYCYPVRRARSRRRMVSSWRRTLTATASRLWRSWSICVGRSAVVLADHPAETLTMS
jgi:hypothetical protein